jgi:hypothetical protein
VELDSRISQHQSDRTDTITPTIVSRAANPKQVRQKYITIDGVKYTAAYADEAPISHN